LFAAFIFAREGSAQESAEAPIPQAAFPSSFAEGRARLDERDRLWSDSERLQQEQKFAEALAAAEQVLAIERDVLGPDHIELATTLDRLSTLAQLIDDLATAQEHAAEALRLRTARLGAEHWRTVSTRWQLDTLARSAKLDAAERQKLAEADELAVQTVQLDNEGRTAEAFPLAHKCIELRRELLGEQHPQFAMSLNNLAWLHQQSREYASAEKLYKQAAEIYPRIGGQNHPDLALSLLNLAMLLETLNRYAEAEPICQQAGDIYKAAYGAESLDYIFCLNHLGMIYEGLGDAARAAPVYKQALELRQQILGEEHPDYATSLNNLAGAYATLGDFAQAEALYQQCLDLRKRILGEDHVAYAMSLNNLALHCQTRGEYSRARSLYTQALSAFHRAQAEEFPNFATCVNNLACLYDITGDYAQAESLYLQSLELRKKLLGEEHPDVATSLNNLALHFQSRGEYARAEPLYEQSLAIYEKTLGPEHVLFAANLNNLALLYQALGDYVRAEPLFEQSLEITAKVHGREHAEYALCLDNLASFYISTGEYARAEPLYRQSLEIRQRTLGERHPDYATTLNNLAWLYQRLDDLAQAEPLAQQAVEVYRQAFGEEHPEYATGLNNLALLYVAGSDFAKAEPMFQQSLAIRRRVLGELHPYYASSLQNFAHLLQLQGKYDEADTHYRQSLDITRHNLELASLVQSERQQRAMSDTLRFQLDNYLTLALEAHDYQEEVYRHVLASKGTVLTRQRALRAVAAQPAIQPAFDELQQVAERLAALVLATPKPAERDVWQQQVAELTLAKERLEADLSRSSAEYRQARADVSFEDLQQALPANAALVDLLEHWQQDRQSKEWSRHLAAFVIRRDRPVQMLPLGAVDQIATTIDQWREEFTDPRWAEAADGTDDPLGRELRTRLWEPLLPFLTDADLILVSPDGVVGRLPWGALPGAQPGHYLIEEANLAMLPVPQLLPELMAEETQAPADQRVLVLGGVDYDRHEQAEVPSAPDNTDQQSPDETRVKSRNRYKPLAGTQAELAAIADLCQRHFGAKSCTRIEGTAASEERFRRDAPRHSYLHVSTHGYFAPPSLLAALEAQKKPTSQQVPVSPASLDIAAVNPGLLSGLAMAGANLPAQAETDDGILTAEEVATLNLSGCELCVLSACETGLGAVAGGEGLLGLQRAFHVAGARTTVATLWKVPDAATRDLMQHFYTNLWEKKLGTLAALRAAQLSILNGDGKRQPPFYWAAFVLSGDWR